MWLFATGILHNIVDLFLSTMLVISYVLTKCVLYIIHNKINLAANQLTKQLHIVRNMQHNTTQTTNCAFALTFGP